MTRYATAKGYTLVELLVAVAIAGLIGGAILGVYRVSQNVYLRASSLEAAQDGARAGLDRMADELRLIGSYWVVGSPFPAATPPTSTSITFIGDVDADTLDTAGQEITLTAQANSGAQAISVNRCTGRIGDNAFTAGEWVYIANGATRRAVTPIAAACNNGVIQLSTALTATIPNAPQPAIVRSLETTTYNLNGTDLRRNNVGIVENVTGLTFTYFDAAGANLGATPPVAVIREIQIALTVQSPDGSGRLMTTRVRPRNL